MDEYKILDEERRSQKQGVHVRHPETAKDTTYLLESGELCWSYKDGKVRYSFPRSRQNRRDLPRDNPLVSVEVLRNRVTTYAVRITWLIADIEDKYHGPSDTLHNHLLKIPQRILVSFLMEINTILSSLSLRDNPQKALKNKGIVDSGCSRHMTGNKAHLVEYQDYNGGPVAFGGSKGYISDKNVKPGPSLDAFDDRNADLTHGMNYMDTEEAVTGGRQRVSTAVNISTASRPKVNTATPMTP
ncbi:hypothetical protein Tco_0885525, partial [Tanacetum coccineum]